MAEEKAKSGRGGVWPTIKPFVNGGASGMLATCVIQPLDMVKVPIISILCSAVDNVCCRVRSKCFHLVLTKDLRTILSLALSYLFFF